MMNQKILFITPPFTQFNTPYPATPYLKGYFNTKLIDSFQAGLSLEVILHLLSKPGLTKIFEVATSANARLSDNSERILAMRDAYLNTIEVVITFLQGKNENYAYLISEDEFLPRASRFAQTDDLEWAFGVMGLRDKARHLATLYLEDLSDLITEAVDPDFGFSRYAERLGRSASSFDELDLQMQKPLTLLDSFLIELLEEKIKLSNPEFVIITIPFPGNLYAALRCGQYIRKHYPKLKIVFGGGFVNTELRSLSDRRLFDYTDYVVLDDGEMPLMRILNHADKLIRTFTLVDNHVIYQTDETAHDVAEADKGTTDYSDLLRDKYLSVIEITNPMHRLWSDGRWNKLTLAHGCYWGKCSFCDGSLDYIRRYEPNTAKMLVDRMESLIIQTGESGFHFVDEAAPPALLKELSLEILRRNLKVAWWTNIRFEKAYTSDLCRLLKAAGCIAVSGGLEVASDRLLKLINKGVTVAQVAHVADHFSQAGIMVHAYLMYGFPTETAQETIDSMDVVRQLFEAGIVQSGFWHRFAMTSHSPVGKDPQAYKTKVTQEPFGGFADNDVAFEDPTGAQHELFSEGLRKSLYNYMNGVGFDLPLNRWFDTQVPKTTIPPRYIERILDEPERLLFKPNSRLVWTGGVAKLKTSQRQRKGKSVRTFELLIQNNAAPVEVPVANEQIGLWLEVTLAACAARNIRPVLFEQFDAELQKHMPGNPDDFLSGEIFATLHENGLLLL